ncbi:MAG TPA: hypothetical protein VMS56_12795 [Thermoanaerobaculia bacterium]|nr:hypothetical protein [Thermoanaerobaculia bacterium]
MYRWLLVFLLLWGGTTYAVLAPAPRLTQPARSEEGTVGANDVLTVPNGATDDDDGEGGDGEGGG